jgi:polyphenol oxidase
MLRKKRGSFEWLEFEILQEFPQVRHGVFLRHGGVSEGPFATLNTVSVHGDDPALVRLNCEKIRKHLGCKALISGKQVHGDQVVVIHDRCNVECDGFVTQTEGLGLAIMHADCQVALLYDPIHHAIGCIHAGWRGNVLNIYEKAVHKMCSTFGSKPADIFACIAPSLGPCCAQFIHYEKEFPPSLWHYQVRPYYFDLWAIGRDQLIAAGILPGHFEMAKMCTYCNPTDFYSFRRDKPTGRHATVICLNDRC